MTNIQEFLRKYFHVFVLLLLIVFAFLLIQNSMSYQHFRFAQIAQSFIGPIDKMCYNITRFFSLSSENEALVQQNTDLLRERDNNFLLMDDSVYTAEQTSFDTLGKIISKKQLYDYLSATVIFNTTSKKHNYLLIDKGANDSIYPDMAVIAPQGVVGVVSEVSDNFSTVISLLHPNSRVSARIMPINQIGTIIWGNNNPDFGYLTDIPQHLKVSIGDSVFTSGFSNVFPPNILIGTVVDKIDNSKNTFLTIKIKFSVPFNNVNNVYLIKNIYKEEIDKLKTNFIDE